MAASDAKERARLRGVALLPKITPAQLRTLTSILDSKGFATRAQQYDWINQRIDNSVRYLDELTFADARTLLDELLPKDEDSDEAVE